MDIEAFKQKIHQAKLLLEDFAATTAALAPYPTVTVGTNPIQKVDNKKKKKVDEKS
jgi:hypothetical protein